MEFLSMSRDQVRRHVSSRGGPEIDKVTVGAAILRHDDASGPRVLLLMRNPDEKYFPGVFELPGGKVDAADPTVRDAVVREVAEETGLAVLDVAAPLSPMAYTTEKPADASADAGAGGGVVARRALQLSYVVVVAAPGTHFRVNEGEHSAGIWAGRDDLDGNPMNPEMRRLVEEALGSTNEERGSISCCIGKLAHRTERE